MKKHVASVHEKNKPFKCEVCNYSCALKRNLQAHTKAVHDRKKHDNKKPFLCPICGNSYSLKPNLKRHIEAVHEKNKPFKCKSVIIGVLVRKV